VFWQPPCMLGISAAMRHGLRPSQGELAYAAHTKPAQAGGGAAHQKRREAPLARARSSRQCRQSRLDLLGSTGHKTPPLHGLYNWNLRSTIFARSLVLALGSVPPYARGKYVVGCTRPCTALTPHGKSKSCSRVRSRPHASLRQLPRKSQCSLPTQWWQKKRPCGSTASFTSLSPG